MINYLRRVSFTVIRLVDNSRDYSRKNSHSTERDFLSIYFRLRNVYYLHWFTFIYARDFDYSANRRIKTVLRHVIDVDVIVDEI